MCIGVPAKVITLNPQAESALVESKNGQQTVSLLMLDEKVEIGDYLLIQVGGFAVEKLDPEQALEMIELIKAIEHGDIERAKQLYT